MPCYRTCCPRPLLGRSSFGTCALCALCLHGRRANRVRTAQVATQRACVHCTHSCFLFIAFFLRLSLEQEKVITLLCLVFVGHTCESDRKGLSSGDKIIRPPPPPPPPTTHVLTAYYLVTFVDNCFITRFHVFSSSNSIFQFCTVILCNH